MVRLDTFVKQVNGTISISIFMFLQRKTEKWKPAVMHAAMANTAAISCFTISFGHGIMACVVEHQRFQITKHAV